MALPLIMGKSTPNSTLSRLRPRFRWQAIMKLRVGDGLVPVQKCNSFKMTVVRHFSPLSNYCFKTLKTRKT